jgi:predicted metal-dependent hydrolase
VSDASKIFTVNKRAAKQHLSDKKLPNGIQKAIRAEKHDSTNHAGKNSRGNTKELFTVKKS